MIAAVRRFVLLAVPLSCACDPSPKPDTKTAAAPAEPAKAPAPPAAKAEPEPLPAAPQGTVVIDGRYVHTCAESKSCPTLMHAEGASHCDTLALGSLKWRLPKIEELESWRGNAALTGFDVFHWSGSAWEDDASQVWIYDPGSAAKTTALPTRKPFTIRCVADPR